MEYLYLDRHISYLYVSSVSKLPIQWKQHWSRCLYAVTLLVS